MTLTNNLALPFLAYFLTTPKGSEGSLRVNLCVLPERSTAPVLEKRALIPHVLNDPSILALPF